MEYMINQDMESILEITGITAEELAEELGVSRIAASNWLNEKEIISEKNVQEFYDYVFKKGIRLNRIKEQLYREEMVNQEEILLFHGAKTEIIGELSINYNKKINDFGNGFYCGETLEQSAMFVSTYEKASLYMLKFSPSGLKFKKYSVDREWMLTIALFRGRLEEYKETQIVKNLIRAVEGIDYIIAPIADNRMFEIIDSFIDGEITDIQCQHCLSATNLGMQYVFLTEKALSAITLLERCYLAGQEKEGYLSSRKDSYAMNQDKVKLARKQYRNQGQYIEEILK